MMVEQDLQWKYSMFPIEENIPIKTQINESSQRDEIIGRLQRLNLKKLGPIMFLFIKLFIKNCFYPYIFLLSIDKFNSYCFSNNIN